MGALPSKACWTLLFKLWVLEAEAEDGAPPEEGGFEVRLMLRVRVHRLACPLRRCLLLIDCHLVTVLVVHARVQCS